MTINAPVPNNNNWLYLLAIIIVIISVKNIPKNLFRTKKHFDIENISTEKEIKQYEDKGIIESRLYVDSLLVVVESLTVQVDSLHLQADLQPKTVYIPAVVDTSMIIANYFRTYTYTVSHKDKDINLKVKFDYQGNKVKNSIFEYKILKPTKITYRPLRGWFYGATVGGSIDRMHQVTPEIMYVKNNQAYKIGYNLLGSKFNLQIGYYLKF